MSAFSKSLLGGAGRICACFSWFLAAMISGNPVLAQTQTLRPLIVTASRLPMRVDQSLADVTVIEREDIERSGQRTLAELLATQPGVQVTSYGGGLSSVFLRGMESRHTLLLVDGVRYGSATTGAPTLDNLPLEFIDRIEIVRGPVSGLYGSDAVGGVIQIFTRQGQQGARPYGQIAIGSNRYSQLSAGLFHAQGAWDTAVQVQHTETKGISATNAHVPWGVFNADRDGFRQNSLSARLGLKLGEGWRADSTLMRSDGVTGFDEGPDSDSRSRLVSEILSFSLQGKMSANWTSTMRWARSKDGFDVVSNDGSYPLGNTGTVQTQLSWENQVDSPFGVWLLLAESLQQEVSRPGAAYEVSRRTIHGLSVGLEGQQGPHGWQANIRQDENSQFGAQT
ncbi:MAG: TonB-dependent receptor plug domain-containing protein, partial [Burkholderiales bacterium]